jgi:hypothetical protein
MQREKSLKVKGEGKNWLRGWNSQVSWFLFQGVQLPPEHQNIVNQRTLGASLALGMGVNLGSAKTVSKCKRLTIP